MFNHFRFLHTLLQQLIFKIIFTFYLRKRNFLGFVVFNILLTFIFVNSAIQKQWFVLIDKNSNVEKFNNNRVEKKRVKVMRRVRLTRSTILRRLYSISNQQISYELRFLFINDSSSLMCTTTHHLLTQIPNKLHCIDIQFVVVVYIGACEYGKYIILDISNG